MTTIFKVLQGTPWWVWVILVLLIVKGVQATKTSINKLHSLFILPIVFIVLALQSLVHTAPTIPLLNAVFLWKTALLVGALGGFLVLKTRSIKADHKKYLVQIPGNITTLILLLSIFAVRYYFGYSLATHPELSSHFSFMAMRLLASGVIAGISLGRLAGYLYHYHKASHTNL